ncbi:MAG: hypothetical protein HY207_08240 [Nitrospirae bacterium]|nr:hypothetical protein [Nitrospirota bacterium]
MGTRRPVSPVILVHGGCGVPRPTASHLAIIRQALGGYALLHTTPYMASGYRVGRIARVSSHFQRVQEAY